MHHRNLFILLSLLILSGRLFAQSDNFPVGSRAAAMANAYVAESDLWSVQHNQAGLGWYPHMSVGFHHENKFVLPEYSLHAFAFSLPIKPATLGFSYTYFGYPIFNETKIGLAAGRQFGGSFSAGLQINYHYKYLDGEYGNRDALSFEGGIQFKPSDRLAFGAHIFNPTRATISAYDQDTIPTIFRTGMSVRPSSKLCLSLEAEKRIQPGMRLRGGIEYELIENLFLRTGIITNPYQNTLGLGYGSRRISADIAFSHHPILGFTPHFSLRANLVQHRQN